MVEKEVLLASDVLEYISGVLKEEGQREDIRVATLMDLLQNISDEEEAEAEEEQ